MGIENLINAINTSDAPICITCDHDLAICRAEWAGELLVDSAVIDGFDYWVDSSRSGEIFPVNSADEVRAVLRSNGYTESGMLKDA